MNRHNLRKALCVVLVASLLEPSFCPAQQLTTPAPSTAPLAPGRPVTAPTTSGPAGGRIMPGPDYRLGPGDTLEVQIAGRLDIDRFQVVVDPTGAISVPPLGSIQVGGLSLLEAHRRVVQRASTVFRFADVTLSVSAPRTLVGGDGRKETLPVDLRAALKPPADISLEPGDALFVPPLSVLQDIVEVRGAFGGTPESSKTTVAGKTTIVQRFELAQGDRVRDFVFRAGGAAAYADLRQAVVERGGATGPRQRIPIDLQRLIVEKDETPNILLQNGDVLTLPVVEDKVYVVGEVKNPGGVEFRPEFTPREYVTLVGGPTPRAKLKSLFVTFRNGKSYAMADAPPLEPGAVVTVPEVAMRWWQDYLSVAQAVASLILGVTGLFVIFNGPIVK